MLSASVYTTRMHKLLAVLLPALTIAALSAQAPAPFRLEETTIQHIGAAFRDRSLTCRSLVEMYLQRIDAHDKQGAQLNAIVVVNPEALKIADVLDRQYRESGPVGPLHCIPVLVKDNFETIDMPTTAGSLSLKDMMTGKDAFVVKRLREAGALMIAKTNMAEFAFSPVETVSSILPGYTRNPYDTTRVTAGSSGGSAAAVAANFAALALASDTGNSIRGPAAHQALVGLRSTMGLVSRAGVVPLNLAADIAGAVTRSVAERGGCPERNRGRRSGRSGDGRGSATCHPGLCLRTPHRWVERREARRPPSSVRHADAGR